MRISPWRPSLHDNTTYQKWKIQLKLKYVFSPHKFVNTLSSGAYYDYASCDKIVTDLEWSINKSEYISDDAMVDIGSPCREPERRSSVQPSK